MGDEFFVDEISRVKIFPFPEHARDWRDDSQRAGLGRERRLRTTSRKIRRAMNFLSPTKTAVQKIFHFPNTHGIGATIRKEPGADVNAACGQLRAKFDGR